MKAITLTGDTGATIAAPNPFPTTSPSNLPPQFTTDNLFVPQAIVFIWGSNANVKIKKITIAGVLPGNGSCADDEYGVLVIDGGLLSVETLSRIFEILIRAFTAASSVSPFRLAANTGQRQTSVPIKRRTLLAMPL